MDKIIIYMYRGNGYLTYQGAFNKKNKDTDKRFKDVGISKIKVPLKYIIKEKHGSIG